jgi:hypothetical protein
MAVIPPIFVQSANSNGSLPGPSPITLTQSNTLSVTQGNLLLCWAQVDFAAGNTATINSVSDGVNVYQSVFTTTFTNGGGGTQRVQLFRAFAATTASLTQGVSFTGTGGTSKTMTVDFIEIKNVLDYNGDVVFAVTSLNPAVVSALTTLNNNDYAVVVSAGSIAPTAASGWAQIVATGSPNRAAYAVLQGQPRATPTLSASNGGLQPCFNAQMSFSSQTASDPNNGNVFLGTPTVPGFGMTWMKNVQLLARDYWDQGLSAPYVGQIYPTPNTGGAQSGQTYPY